MAVREIWTDPLWATRMKAKVVKSGCSSERSLHRQDEVLWLARGSCPDASAHADCICQFPYADREEGTHPRRHLRAHAHTSGQSFGIWQSRAHSCLATWPWGMRRLTRGVGRSSNLLTHTTPTTLTRRARGEPLPRLLRFVSSGRTLATPKPCAASRKEAIRESR